MAPQIPKTTRQSCLESIVAMLGKAGSWEGFPNLAREASFELLLKLSKQVFFFEGV